ncbi:MAG: hypothetical protein DYG86_08190 [Chloroflexi bacterium CFX2]|nr:hypothetical protein [Chloroflexi bacterium CFX2]
MPRESRTSSAEMLSIVVSIFLAPCLLLDPSIIVINAKGKNENYFKAYNDVLVTRNHIICLRRACEW